jgi:hypothetical protein
MLHVESWFVPLFRSRVVAGNYSSNQAGESSGEWDVRPLAPPILPARRTPGPSLVPLNTPVSTSTSQLSSRGNIMATPPPRRPMIPTNAQPQSQSNGGMSTSTPKLSLVTMASGSGSGSGTSTPRVNTAGAGPPQLNLSIGGGRAAPPKPRAPVLSLNIPLPGSSNQNQQGKGGVGGAGVGAGMRHREMDSGQPSPAFDEMGGIQTAYHGGMGMMMRGMDGRNMKIRGQSRG